MSADEAAERPDIILVITDDMRDSDWRALVKTRQLVGEQGTAFPNFFLTTPICSPSRTSILTGQYAHNHLVLRNDGKLGGYAQFKQQNLGDISISTALHTAGYRTGLFGKFLNGMPAKGGLPGSWDQWMATSELAYYRPEMNDNGKKREFKKKKQYSTDILRNRANTFIRTTSPAQPLFLMFTPKAPHGPATAARRDRGRFDGARRELSPDVNEVDVSDKPDHVRHLTGISESRLHDEEQKRLESLIATDDALESLLDTMQEVGRPANPYVFVVSDNGFNLGSHRVYAKDYPYNESARVAMMAAGPRFGNGDVDPRLAANIDLAATFADIAGIPFTTGDGLSLLGAAERDAVLLEAWTVNYAALRTARYLYVENDSGERELYDYETDPYEIRNLLADWEGHTPEPAAEDVAVDLQARLDELRLCAGTTCA